MPASLPTVRVLLLADTHIGLDLPVRPRIERRRRGHDFIANFQRALAPALAGEVDLVVHGGDLLDRSKVPTAVVELALQPLIAVADSGVPVYLVPGNHERSVIPNMLLTAHPRLHVFNSPGRARLALGEADVEITAFPFARRIGERFTTLLAEAERRVVRGQQTGGRPRVRLLCMHQAVEGAQVGPSNYTFRPGRDVIPGHAFPGGYAAALSGHIHRSQILDRDLTGAALATPVIYPGSVERTSLAERHEEKHFVVLDLVADGSRGGRVSVIEFRPLPARPMFRIDVDLLGAWQPCFEREIRERLAALPCDAVVRVVVTPAPNGPDSTSGVRSEPCPAFLSAARLRAIAPPTMNIELSFPRPARPERAPGPTGAQPARPGRPLPADAQPRILP